MCSENSVGALASDNEGAQYLMEIVGTPLYVADIWFGLTSFEIDCGVISESCGYGKILLTRDQCLLEIFGRGPCWFWIFGSGLTLVEDVDVPDWSPMEDTPWGYVGIW